MPGGGSGSWDVCRILGERAELCLRNRCGRAVYSAPCGGEAGKRMPFAVWLTPLMHAPSRLCHTQSSWVLCYERVL